ncbi:hypothetical protein IAD21_06239 [Abditibacteriota bacterium]|nr:hypothetical protein IAD21_06239 [Abditibacteriota bacterium]
MAATLLPAQADDVLELDELWAMPSPQIWIWVVLCRRTLQVVAWMWA